LLERGAHAEPVRPHRFTYSNRESALGGNALERDRNAPRQRFPLAFFGTRHLQATRSSTNAPLPTRDLPPTFAAHLIVPSSSAISKSLRSTAMAAIKFFAGSANSGLSPSFPRSPKPRAQRAREKALGCASVRECPLRRDVLPRRDRQMCVTHAERPMGGAFPPADRQPRDAAAGAVTPLPSSV
jgi:hypothetical protein